MSIPSPFSAGFPLKPTPFKSRTEQHLNNSKNYFAVAFKPGFPLQASELNEIQEIFYVQQTLNNELINSGWTGIAPWTGATPMSKDMITMDFTGDVSVGTGWYHIQDPQINGGLGVWAYNDTVRTVTPVHAETSGSSPDYGLKVKTVTVECSTNSTPGTNEDVYLQDQSNYNVIGGPCGAARLKLEISGAGSTAASDEILANIFRGPITITNTSRTITFVNNDTTQVTP